MLYLTLNLNPIMRSATLVYRVFATYYRPASRNSASAISLGFERRREREREREGEGGRGRERERESAYYGMVITFTYYRLTTYHVGSWDPRLLHRAQRQSS